MAQVGVHWRRNLVGDPVNGSIAQRHVDTARMGTAKPSGIQGVGISGWSVALMRAAYGVPLVGHVRTLVVSEPRVQAVVVEAAPQVAPPCVGPGYDQNRASIRGRLAQLARALPLQGRCRRFESCIAHLAATPCDTMPCCAGFFVFSVGGATSCESCAGREMARPVPGRWESLGGLSRRDARSSGSGS